jgi:hypothetical protein
MSLEASSVLLRIASDIGRAANDFGWIKVSVGTTHSREALPSEFKNQYVYLVNTHASAFAEVAVSISSTAEVDTAVAATNNTTTPTIAPKVGTPIPPNSFVRLHLPEWDESATAYLIHEGTAALTLYLGKGSGAR